MLGRHERTVLDGENLQTMAAFHSEMLASRSTRTPTCRPAGRTPTIRSRSTSTSAWI